MTQAARLVVDWSEIDAVFVDMDGTLLDLAFDNVFWLEIVPARFAEARGLSAEAARREVTARFDSAAGTLAWYCLDHWSRDLDLDLRRLKHDHRERIRFLPGAREFLAAVRERGKHLKLVTNAHRDTLAVKARQTGIDRLVDSIVCSHDLRAPKESLDFWSELQRREPFDRERTLLIEDSLAVLTAAAAHGLKHTCAIRRPDSRLPAREIDAFPAIDGVAELL
jgi:putative hydrolase of the HAD superfamily